MKALLLLACAWPPPAAAGPAGRELAGLQALFDSRRYQEIVRSLSEDRIEGFKRPERARVYELLGLSHQGLGEIDKALGVFQVGAGLFPGDINLLTHLATALHRAGLDDRALPAYERILRIHPNNAVANLGLAEIARSHGFLDQAVRRYEKALGEWRDRPELWRALAETRAELRDYRGAAEAMSRSLALDPDDPEALRSLAALQRRRNSAPPTENSPPRGGGEFPAPSPGGRAAVPSEGDPGGHRRQDSGSEAYQTLERAIQAIPRRQDLRGLKALWLLEDGRLQESYEEAGRLLEGSPRDPLGLWLRALIALRRGERERARRDLAEVSDRRREAPFAAKAARAMLLEMDRRP